jgi:biopolymer transport protein ExbB
MDTRRILDAGTWLALGLAVTLTPAAQAWAAQGAPAEAAPAPEASHTLLHLFRQGGLIMWPLLIASIISLSVAIERVIFLVGEKNRRNATQLRDFFVEVSRGNIQGAEALARHSQDCIVQTLGYALEHRDQSLPHALSVAESRTLKRYRRGVGVLDTVITLAPLLGLLGTVTGMMGSFSMIGGQVGAPSAITGGIAEALIATAFGLCIAIASLLPFNWLNNKLEELETDLRENGDHLKQLLEGRRGASSQAEPSCQSCGSASHASHAPDSLRLAVHAAEGR